MRQESPQMSRLRSSNLKSDLISAESQLESRNSFIKIVRDSKRSSNTRGISINDVNKSRADITAEEIDEALIGAPLE